MKALFCTFVCGLSVLLLSFGCSESPQLKYFDNESAVLKFPEEARSGDGGSGTQEAGFYVALWREEKCEEEQNQSLEYRFGSVTQETKDAASTSVLIYKKDEKGWRVLSDFPGTRAIFSDRDGADIFVSSPVNANLKFSLSAAGTSTMEEQHEVMLYNFLRGGGVVMPKKLQQRLFEVMKTDGYQKYEKYFFENWGKFCAIYIFNQKPGQACGKEDIRILPFSHDHHYGRFIAMPYDGDDAEMKKAYDELSAIARLSTHWYRNIREHDSFFKDESVEKSPAFSWLPITDSIFVTNEGILDLPGDRDSFLREPKKCFSNSYIFFPILKKLELKELVGAYVFNAKAVRQGGNAYFLLRYNHAGNAKKFKDILFGAEFSSSGKSTGCIDFLGVVSEFDSGNAPAYRFSEKENALFYSVPCRVQKIDSSKK